MRERDKRGVAGEVERKGGKGVLNIRTYAEELEQAHTHAVWMH